MGAKPAPTVSLSRPLDPLGRDIDTHRVVFAPMLWIGEGAGHPAAREAPTAWSEPVLGAEWSQLPAVR